MIPRPALTLGLAGLLPFLWGALGVLVPVIDDQTTSLLSQRFGASYILISYGTVILCFMSGVLWGFATKTNAAAAYALSTLPALWAFFTIGGGGARPTTAVLIGFLLVFACDVQFARWNLTPAWWLKLRALLTVIVCACLLIGVYA
ncbi:uncharacterized protein DUF3429 [Litoreibacter meonggei]|uniref:Uncharacterized protein DUF3429 n=1 Tax=Litoreibacter meonggei TaxID=1049199 RepID=A0A497VRW9_9RHOB|nr:DUF3429 domain-containing protein [Litoreibacter meonggei]RLJ40819.1 uncharacterized protein DUF3429 [Litoreibacter meonggei]